MLKAVLLIVSFQFNIGKLEHVQKHPINQSPFYLHADSLLLNNLPASENPIYSEIPRAIRKY